MKFVQGYAAARQSTCNRGRWGISVVHMVRGGFICVFPPSNAIHFSPMLPPNTLPKVHHKRPVEVKWKLWPLLLVLNKEIGMASSYAFIFPFTFHKWYSADYSQSIWEHWRLFKCLICQGKFYRIVAHLWGCKRSRMPKGGVLSQRPAPSLSWCVWTNAKSLKAYDKWRRAGYSLMFKIGCSGISGEKCITTGENCTCACGISSWNSSLTVF